MLAVWLSQFTALCLLVTLLLMTSTADDVEYTDEELEFAGDVVENYDLKQEMSPVPEWSLPDQGEEKNHEQELWDLLRNREIQTDFILNDKAPGGTKSNPIRDAYLLEKDDDKFADSDYPNMNNINLRKKRNALFRLIENFLENFINRKANFPRNLTKNQSRCSTFPRRTFSKSIVSCGEIDTDLGALNWCRHNCKRGYRLRNPLHRFEICGRATGYRWSFQLKGKDHPEARCIVGTSRNRKKACTTAECFTSAAYYMNKIDYSKNPCENFFDFACGRWIRESKIPKSRSVWLTYSIIRDRVSRQMAKLLRKPIQKNDAAFVIKAKNFYSSCMNTDLIERLDSQPLLRLLQGDIVWPIIEKKWNRSSFNFEKTAAELRRKYNNKYAMSIKMGIYKGLYTLEIWKGSMLLPCSYYILNKLKPKLAEYYLLIYDVAIMLGADPRQAYYDIEELKNFEKKLTKIKIFSFKKIHPTTVGVLQKEIKNINWMKLFKQILPSHQVTSNTPVVVMNMNYLKKFAKLLKRTDNRVIQNYMVWTIVKFRIKNLSQRFQSRVLIYEHKMSGKRALDPRMLACSKQTIISMKGATSKLFIDNYFTEARKKAASKLFDFIKQGFIQLLKTEVEWMDSETKFYAKKKALAIQPQIGYNPHLYENTTYLNEQVQNLVIQRSDYFGNYIRLLTRCARNSFSQLGQPHNKSAFTFHTRATTVNAFYSPRHNVMVLPGGELQYPFYWGSKYQRVIEFGAIGTILGHELTHGFDNLGRRFDINGNLKNWWSNSSLMEFKKRSNCIKQQYSSYMWKAAGEYLNGKKELGENIADNGGIRESYAGYKLWLKSKNISEEGINPAIGLTNDQLFFVAFANDRCSHFTKNGARENLAINPHSPGRFRVIGSLQNFDKFSEAFNCPLGSYMNPPQKCVIW